MEKEKLLNAFCTFLKNQRYHFGTIKIYKNTVYSFLVFFGGNELRYLSPQTIQTFIDLKTPNTLSTAYKCQAAAAIRLFYKNILNTEMKLNYPEKRIIKLPLIFSTVQVKSLLVDIKNLKHRTLLSLIYSAGLRLSEAIYLKKSSVFLSERRMEIVPESTGKKRSVIISEKMFRLLSEYFKQYKPVCWLFETNKNLPYSPRTVQQIFKNALMAGGFKNEASISTLRHSFAVHLVEQGTDIKLVQQILGHKSVKSTLVYSQLSNISISRIVNPFDIL